MKKRGNLLTLLLVLALLRTASTFIFAELEPIDMLHSKSRVVTLTSEFGEANSAQISIPGDDMAVKLSRPDAAKLGPQVMILTPYPKNSFMGTPANWLPKKVGPERVHPLSYQQ